MREQIQGLGDLPSSQVWIWKCKVGYHQRIVVDVPPKCEAIEETGDILTVKRRGPRTELRNSRKA